MKEKRIRIFILFVKSSFINTVLDQANQVGLVGPQFLWISGTSAVDDLVGVFICVVFLKGT